MFVLEQRKTARTPNFTESVLRRELKTGTLKVATV